MESFAQKRQEWSSQAKFIENNCFQNGRKIPQLIFDEIINDIKSKLLLDQKNKSLIDVGCGNGVILSSLSGYFDKLFGCDYSQEMVESAKKININADVVVCESAKLPFNDNLSSHLLSYSIFHYFPSISYAKKSINEFIRVCNPNGIILIGDILDIKFKEEIISSDDVSISSELPLIHRYSHWLFYDFEDLANFCLSNKKVKDVKILSQPKILPFHSYRKDLLLCL